jgi:hypothetical protein
MQWMFSFTNLNANPHGSPGHIEKRRERNR